MAAIPVTITGVIADLHGRTITGPVKLMGEMVYSDRGVGGGPMPPGEGGGGGDPPGIWGPTDPRPGWGLPGPQPGGPHPEHPIVYPPGIWGPTDPRPGYGPIVPPENVPPGMQPPETPAPGSPVTPVPPPPGQGGWPVQPQTVPPYVVVNYPGVGPCYVPAPLTAQPKPT